MSLLSFGEAYAICIDNITINSERGRCLQKLSKAAVESLSIPEIEQGLDGVRDAIYRRWCHEFMHYAGWALYTQTGSFSESFILASDECDAGMRHGVVEEYISEESLSVDPETFVTKIIPTACKESVQTYRLRVGAENYCLHGLGHAFMFITRSNLPDSLKYCDYLQHSNESERCYTGVFMENIDNKEVGRFGVHVSSHPYNTDNPDYPCNILEEKHKNNCYRYKGVYNMNRYIEQNTLYKAFEDCSLVEYPYTKQCWWGIGSNLPAPTVSGSQAGIYCKAALEVSSEAYQECIGGAMSFLTQLHWNNPQEAVSFCNEIESEYKNLCYREAGSYFQSLSESNSDLIQKCYYFPDDHARDACMHNIEIQS